MQYTSTRVTCRERACLVPHPLPVVDFHSSCAGVDVLQSKAWVFSRSVVSQTYSNNVARYNWNQWWTEASVNHYTDVVHCLRTTLDGVVSVPINQIVNSIFLQVWLKYLELDGRVACITLHNSLPQVHESCVVQSPCWNQ